MAVRHDDCEVIAAVVVCVWCVCPVAVFIYIEQDIIYAYLARNFLVNITQSLKDNPDLKAANYAEGNFTSFADNFRGENSDLFGIPMEAFIKVYLYRTDLFNDPDIKAAFKEKTGRDLVPAKTHAEYSEIAHFFTDYMKEKGEKVWGSTAQALGNTSCR